MGDLLRFAAEHPRAEVVGISDEKPERMGGDAQTSPAADIWRRPDFGGNG